VRIAALLLLFAERPFSGLSARTGDAKKQRLLGIFCREVKRGVSTAAHTSFPIAAQLFSTKKLEAAV
jgi:hypothetical protein